MMRRFFVICLLLVALISTALASPTQAQETQSPDVFYGHWAYQFNPPVKLNSLLPDGFPGALGIYADLIEPPLAYFQWNTYSDYHGILATAWGFEGDDAYSVTLRDDAQWSDGTPITARDLVVTYLLGRLRGIQDYRYISTVTASDEHTVTFQLKRPGLIMERLILKTRLRPASVYGEIANKVQALLDEGDNLAQFEAGSLQQTDAWRALQTELAEFQPAQIVSSGPYTLDGAAITATEVTLQKSTTSVFKPTFEGVVIYRGNVDKLMTRMQAGEIIYSADQYSPDVEPELEGVGYELLRTSTYTGASLYFNGARATLGKPEVRQAIAYILDRPAIAAAALGESAVPMTVLSGISEERAAYYLDETDTELNLYEPDAAAAEALLTSVGYSKGTRGWVDQTGEAITYRLHFPAEVPRYPQAATEMARQLNEFGINTVAEGVTSTQLLRDVVDGRFDLLLYTYGVIGNPFPYVTYRNTFYSLNEPGLQQGKQGIAFPLTQTIDGQDYDLAALIAQLEDEGGAVDANETVSQIATVFNTLLPALPIYERYTNTPLLVGKLSGVPSADDPIYKNAYTTDNYVILWLLEGTIAPN